MKFFVTKYKHSLQTMSTKVAIIHLIMICVFGQQMDIDINDNKELVGPLSVFITPHLMNSTMIILVGIMAIIVAIAIYFYKKCKKPVRDRANHHTMQQWYGTF